LNQILVIDDEEDIRESLVDLLKLQNYSVISARNGQDALDLLRTLKEMPRLIILDGKMPVMDGKTFFRHLSQDPKMKTIAVLVVAGSDQAIPNLSSNCRFFQKPFPVDQLLAVIAEMLELPHQNSNTNPDPA
jgi:two-component system, sensor histidine kinase and response regulator